MNIENITIFSDASFCWDTKAAGGAFWARGTEVKFNLSFQIEDAQNNSDAEIATACRAIHEVAAHPVLGLEMAKGRETRLVIVADSQEVKLALEQGRIRLRAETQKRVAQALQLVREKNCWLKVNHVKGHSGRDTPRQWVNHWCDKEAGLRMEELREARRG